MLQHPAVDSDDRASGDMVTAYRDTTSGDVALEEETDGGVHAHCFFCYCVEVREVRLGFFVGDGVAEEAGGVRSVDLFEEFLELGGVAEEEVDYCSEGDCGCVAAGEDVCALRNVSGVYARGGEGGVQGGR